MSARILDGAAVAGQIRAEVAAEVRELRARGIEPGLGVLMAGDDAGSDIYVRNKAKACDEVGIHVVDQQRFAAAASTSDLLSAVDAMNTNNTIDGILVQLPLPRGVDAARVLESVDPAKDVDGFHPVNVGRLATRREGLRPCTPAGVIELLRRSGIAIAGANTVVVGRSDIVGRPVATMLLNLDATVTVCHSKTRDLEAVCRTADILIAAIGKPGLITREFVKPGATVIDVGINRISDRATFERLFAGDAKREATFAKKGSVVAGDVHPAVAGVAGALSPVPGGVGPLTIAMLMTNVVTAAKLRRGTTIAASAERA
jgi:methylenetetrahydrofolate dehydrogenase (NADP+) / methenyltetrahydrofolate cyclohydrolase